MATWILVPCLAQLRTDLNNLCPDRDRKSDGTIGDDAHQASVSDHNDDEVGRVPIRDTDSRHEVHAYDADADLRTPGLTMEAVVQHILSRCRSGAENRLRYIIFNRRIWEASNGWRQRAYTGNSPHTEHAHFSASYVTVREADARSWKLEEIPVALTNEDKDWIGRRIDSAIDARIARIADAVWNEQGDVNVGYRATNPDGTKRSPSPQKMVDILRHLSPEGAQGRDLVRALGSDVATLAESVNEMREEVRAAISDEPTS